MKVTDDSYIQLINRLRRIVETGQRQAYADVSRLMTETYWKVGQTIVEIIQTGDSRATYGNGVMKLVANSLSAEFGDAYSLRNLQYMRKFYLMFPDFEKVNTRVHFLSWSHYRALLRVENEDARYWYLAEADKEMWSVRTLSRNIGSQYYHRLIQSPAKQEVINEMLELTAPLQEPKEYIKNPVVAEFLQLPFNASFKESELEKAIIAHLKEFLLELGRGFAFVAEQQHIVTDTDDYFIDLVFYNYILKCFVLIDLKTTTLSYQDVGQMDMYVKMYDEMKRNPGDNPTVGLLLCAETNRDVAHYSVLNSNKQLFASKYYTYLPTAEELRNEIEKQKEIYRGLYQSSI